MKLTVMILEQCMTGAIKHQIIMHTRCSIGQSRSYTRRLCEADYLRKQGEQYFTTSRGQEFLRRFYAGAYR
jgi:predicted transcriptional regulator